MLKRGQFAPRLLSVPVAVGAAPRAPWRQPGVFVVSVRAESPRVDDYKWVKCARAL
jgi:hypothetical protein